jgi:hypothetical protein
MGVSRFRSLELMPFGVRVCGTITTDRSQILLFTTKIQEHEEEHRDYYEYIP